MSVVRKGSLHKIPGEYVYENAIYGSAFPKEVLERVKNDFQLRDDDVIVSTYPKSGTTWILEIVWLIMNDVDVVKAEAITQDVRIPFLEIYLPGLEIQSIDRLGEADSPRIIKTHLSYKFFQKQLTTKKTKLILGARNIKDTLVSFYHFYRMYAGLGKMTGPFSEFFELFKEKKIAGGDWFEFYLDYWNNRKNINFFLVKYEDLHKDFHGTIRKLAVFLGKKLSNEQINDIESHATFDKMKSNEAVNNVNISRMDHSISPFMRKGKIGDWKNYFTDEQNEYIDNLYKEKIEGTGLFFDFELENFVSKGLGSIP